MAKLNEEKVTKLIGRKKKGLPSKLIAQQLEISKRRVNQVWLIHEKTGSFRFKQTWKKTHKGH